MFSEDPPSKIVTTTQFMDELEKNGWALPKRTTGMQIIMESMDSIPKVHIETYMREDEMKAFVKTVQAFQITPR